ncbi:hypothetical protein MNBD_ALPHA07-2305 [hydrothermal vent metagenome]|uniref:Apolipoprotein acyltransferase n=1 Tax=hydrothermal vent metagenome TaxID=652676 RepID=A0A3B0RVJ9_9ZZZZ
MIILFGAILGAIFGAFKARRRKGKPADIAQYAFIYAVLFALIALFITITFFRMV